MRFFTTTSVVLTTLAAASSVSAHQAGGRKTYAAFSDYHAKYINSDAAATSETLRLVKRGDVVGTATAYLKTLVPDAEFELNKDQVG